MKIGLKIEKDEKEEEKNFITHFLLFYFYLFEILFAFCLFRAFESEIKKVIIYIDH